MHSICPTSAGEWCAPGLGCDRRSGRSGDAQICVPTSSLDPTNSAISAPTSTDSTDVSTAGHDGATSCTTGARNTLIVAFSSTSSLACIPAEAATGATSAAVATARETPYGHGVETVTGEWSAVTDPAADRTATPAANLAGFEHLLGVPRASNRCSNIVSGASSTMQKQHGASAERSRSPNKMRSSRLRRKPSMRITPPG
mmetsp:Transcript_20578/g.45940  ORF Transcript_20578/g.45940 Transcript_20578/m.45940 type:complete len:200 (+) Transcript_20578:837-1436(+)